MLPFSMEIKKVIHLDYELNYYLSLMTVHLLVSKLKRILKVHKSLIKLQMGITLTSWKLIYATDYIQRYQDIPPKPMKKYDGQEQISLKMQEDISKCFPETISCFTSY